MSPFMVENRKLPALRFSISLNFEKNFMLNDSSNNGEKSYPGQSVLLWIRPSSWIALSGF
jgi:hypothetical protein